MVIDVSEAASEDRGETDSLDGLSSHEDGKEPGRRAPRYLTFTAVGPVGSTRRRHVSV